VPGEFAEVVVAGTNFDPGIGYADQRLSEVFIAKAASAQHGARAGAAGAINQSMAAWFWGRLRHCEFPPVDCTSRLKKT